MATRNYLGNITALGLRVNRRSIVSVRDFETIKLRKSIVKRCNRYDNGSYKLNHAVRSELYLKKILAFWSFTNIKILTNTKAKVIPFDGVTNDMTNRIND